MTKPFLSGGLVYFMKMRLTKSLTVLAALGLTACSFRIVDSSSSSTPSKTASSSQQASDSFFDNSSTSEPYIDPTGTSSKPSSAASSSQPLPSSSKEEATSSEMSSQSKEESSQQTQTTSEATSSSEEPSSEQSLPSSEEPSSTEPSEESSDEPSSSEMESSSEELSSSEETSSLVDSSEESIPEASSEDESSQEPSSIESSVSESEEVSEDPSGQEPSEESSEPGSEEVSSFEPSSSQQPSSSEPVYDEDPDSTEGIDVNDLSSLYDAFATPITNYTSTVKGYFTANALKNYYAHYQKNYVQDNVTLLTDDALYRYPTDPAYLGVLNMGRVDLDGNAYGFALQGDSVEERLASTLTNDDLQLLGESDSYRNHLFTLEDLGETFFATFGFARVSENKYQYDRMFKSDQDNVVFNAFIDLCAPGLINTGYYMTFSKATIELNPTNDVAFRLRLYAYDTQIGKLDPTHRKEEYPNWYLLFSEAEITSVGTTSIDPINGLLNE